jgi:hypothetical protein
VPWVETESPHFAARHELEDEDGVVDLLSLLEATWARLEEALGDRLPGSPVDVVVHGSDASLLAAKPALVLVRRLAAPAGRRYLAGWPGSASVHVLAPRLLARRASNVAGSAEALGLAPAALLAQLAVGTANPSVRRSARHAWALLGAAQWLAGQSGPLRPAIARRLREGPRPAFPPGARDAVLLGGSVFELCAREEGRAAATALALDGAPDQAALRAAFGGRPVPRTEDAWRSALDRIRPA